MHTHTHTHTHTHKHTHKLLELTNKFRKAVGYKIKREKSVIFLYNSNEPPENEIKKTFPFTIEKKNT